VALERYMSKNESTKRQCKDKVSRIKNQTCYTCHDKGHLSKDWPKSQTFIHKDVNNNISHVEPKYDTSTIKMISSPCDSPRAIWGQKHLLTNMKDSTSLGYKNLLDQVVGDLRCIRSLTIDKEMQYISSSQAQEHVCLSLSNDISKRDKCLPLLKFNLYFLTLLVCIRINHMARFLKTHSIVPYDALNVSFVEQYVYHDRYTLLFARK
jgi:hypothetical protein